MTKFIPKLGDISTKFSGSEETERQTISETKSQSTTQESSLGSKTEPATVDSSTPQPEPKSKLVAGLRRVIPQRVLESQWLDPHNPLYRTRKFWISVGVGVGVSGGAIAVGVIWWNLDRSLPDPAEVVTFVRDGTLTIKAEDGTILQQRGEATREKVTLDEMPPMLVQGFIASEDHRFYQHKGVDYQGILRAFVSNLVARDVVEGGSTITQQLARIVFLNQERTIWRKIREIMLAQKIEQKLSKQQVLERYLNLVYLGEGAYGVADAAWVYFSKPLEELTLPEIATLVGLTPAPAKYSPMVDDKAALTRRNIVLQRMQQAGFITADAAKAAIAEPLEIHPEPPKRLATEAPYFTSYIEQELPKYIPSEAVEAGGLIVETSLNRAWQKQAEEVVAKAIERYGRGQRFKQAALVSIDPRNGEVKAMVGGTDFDDTQFNRVTQAMRQPGSTFKGFVYATAIAAGFSPYRGYLDAPFTVDGYTPKNYSETHRGWLSMRDALIKSINTVAVRALIDVGFNPVIETAHKMGIKSELKPVYSLALGGVELNLLELTNAYGTLANKGMHVEAHGIRRVLDRRGKVLYEANFASERALDEETSAIMTWMLRGVVNGGTGGAASLPNRQVAGKTGTSDEARDLWFIGYIPQVVTGVWLGNDDNKPTWGASSTAALTWHNFMAKAVEGMPIEKFPPRPEKMEGRKGIIKAEPIRPGRVYTMRVRSNNSDNDSSTNRRGRSSEAESSQPQTYRRRYRSYNQAASNDNSQSTAPVRRRRYYSSSSDNSSSQQQTYTPRRRRSYSSSSDSSSSQQQTYTPRRRRSYNSSSDSSSSQQQTYTPRRRRSYSSSSDSSSSQQQTYTPRRRRSYNSSSSSNNNSSSQQSSGRRRYRSEQQPVRRRSNSSPSRATQRQAPTAPSSLGPAPAAPSIDFKDHH